MFRVISPTSWSITNSYWEEKKRKSEFLLYANYSFSRNIRLKMYCTFFTYLERDLFLEFSEIISFLSFIRGCFVALKVFHCKSIKFEKNKAYEIIVADYWRSIHEELAIWKYQRECGSKYQRWMKMMQTYNRRNCNLCGRKWQLNFRWNRISDFSINREKIVDSN